MIKNILLILLLILLISPSFRSLERPGYFPMHDDQHVIRLLEMDKCFKDFQIPCRWVPDLGFEYGYPQFNYYPPLPYYVMEIIHLLGLSFLDSVKIGFILSLIFSSITMFYFCRAIFGNIGGFVGAIFYTYAPARASDIYSRGALNEAWSFIFLPLILLGIHQWLVKKNPKSLLFLSFGVAGLFTTHNPTALVFIPMSFFVAIVLLWFLGTRIHFWKNIIRLIGAFALGVGLAAFFLLPALLEIGFAHTETLRSGYFDYRAHFASVQQILTSTHFGYGSSEIGPYDDMSFSVGIIHWVLSVATLIIVLWAFMKKRNLKIFLWVALLFGLGIFSTFMTHQKSSFIWEKLPILSYLQFPWRFLVITDLCSSALVGGLFFYIKEIKLKIILSLFLISLPILFYGLIFQPRIWLNINDADKFSGQNWEKGLTSSIFDYLPKSAKFPPATEASASAFFVSGQGEIENYKRTSNTYTFSTTILENAKIIIPTFDFPGWKVYQNDNLINHSAEGDLGLVSFDLQKGRYNIEAKLENTPIRVIGNILTLVSFGIIILIISKNIKFLWIE